jgi:DNA modification methylase
MFKKPPLELQTTTLWYYPSQHYGTGMQGDKNYKGATPSYIIWNLLKRYTKPGDKVLDPMCGSGTTLDVCRDLGREGVGFDLRPTRKDMGRADARHLPLHDNTMDFVFVDPPYSTHLKYSGLPECIGELSANGGGYYEAMAKVITEMRRVLKPGGYLGLYVSDSWEKGEPFMPIGFELFALLRQHLTPIDIVSVSRHHKTLKKDHWHKSAELGNYFLRGFNYLFIMQKPGIEEVAVTPAVKPKKVPQLSPLPPKMPRGKKPKKKKYRI